MRVGRYELGRLLGEGGMGSVHEATHVVTGKRVAVKLLKPAVMSVAGALERFLTEARAACGVDHPNVVDVLDVDVEDGTAYMVIELLDGESLEERLERGPMSVGELWAIAEPLLAALAKAHARGILHRDLKPANIFLATDASHRAVPKLLDFGIAKLLGADELSLTATGHMVGTPLYMPPEIIAGEKSARPECDIYSFAAVCYEALAGHPPHQAQTLPQLLLAVSQSDPDPLEERGVPEAVAAVIRTGMARDPADRFSSASAFAGALEAAVAGEPAALGLANTAPSIRPGPIPTPTAPLESTGGAGRRRWAWIGVAVVTVAIGVAAVVGLRDEAADLSEPPALAEEPASVVAEPSEEVSERAEPDAPATEEATTDESEPAAVPEARAEPRRTRTSARRRPIEPPAEMVSEPTTEPEPEGEEPLRVEGERSGGLSADEF